MSSRKDHLWTTCPIPKYKEEPFEPEPEGFTMAILPTHTNDPERRAIYAIGIMLHEPHPDSVEKPGSLTLETVTVPLDDELAPSIRVMEEHGKIRASKNMGEILCRNIDACLGPKLGKCPILGEVGLKAAINEYYWVEDKK